MLALLVTITASDVPPAPPVPAPTVELELPWRLKLPPTENAPLPRRVCKGSRQASPPFVVMFPPPLFVTVTAMPCPAAPPLPPTVFDVASAWFDAEREIAEPPLP